jgi:hypothetical protein
MINKLFISIRESLAGAKQVAKYGSKSLIKNPQIAVYPYLAAGFILLTSPIVTSVVINLWNRLEPDVVNQATSQVPSLFWEHFGLVAFPVFYAIFVTSFFVCAIAASTLARLENRKVPPYYGLQVIGRRFFRVAGFALLAPFFFPLGLVAQRRRFRSLKGAWRAISSSFSLSTAQMAPAIVSRDDGIYDSVCYTVDRLGTLWKESLVIRIGTFMSILLLGSVSFLPKLIENLWFDGSTARVIGWIATILLGATSYVVLRLVSTVFTTTLYHQAKNK